MDWLQIWILLLIAFFIISKTKISKTTKPCTITTTNMTNQEFTDATRNDSFDGFNKSQHTTRRKLPSNRDYSPIVRKLDKTSHSNLDSSFWYNAVRGLCRHFFVSKTEKEEKDFSIPGRTRRRIPRKADRPFAAR